MVNKSVPAFAAPCRQSAGCPRTKQRTLRRDKTMYRIRFLSRQSSYPVRKVAVTPSEYDRN